MTEREILSQLALIRIIITLIDRQDTFLAVKDELQKIKQDFIELQNKLYEELLKKEGYKGLTH